MTAGTVVVLNSGDGGHASLRLLLLDGAYPAVSVVPAPGPDDALAARVCSAINARPPQEPLTLVAFGRDGLLLPAVALAQRAAHRRVRGYLLVDAAAPAVTDSWPDAPVTVFSDSPDPLAALRGWTVRPLAELVHWRPDD